MKVRVKNVGNRNTPSNWFEIGKAYKAGEYERGKFLIADPSATLVGGKWTCCLKDCSHLNGGDWEIIKESFWEKFRAFFTV